MTNKEIIAKINNRERSSSKYTYGKALLVCGKPGMMGAAILAARAAFRIGAGLVVLSCDESQHILIHESIPEAMCIGRKEIKDINEYASIGFGCAAGLDTKELLESILKEYRGKLVIDADGLTVLGKNPEIAEGHRCELILTPHTGEAGRLLNISREKVEEDRIKSAMKISEMFNAVALVKGDATKIYDEAHGLTENKTGNAGMATAGSGDVLTGIITGLLAQGISGYDAAKAGAYIHGIAGDIAAEEIGMTSLMAGDIAEKIYPALKQFDV